jgi:hypothetical protein
MTLSIERKLMHVCERLSIDAFHLSVTVFEFFSGNDLAGMQRRLLAEKITVVQSPTPKFC